jgi:hypothetical protein
MPDTLDGDRARCHRAMNFELSEEQQLMQETFARFLNEASTMDRVRAALPSGFDQAPLAKTIYGGTSEIHRSMIAERALNLPRTRA